MRFAPSDDNLRVYTFESHVLDINGKVVVVKNIPNYLPIQRNTKSFPHIILYILECDDGEYP